MRGVGGVFQASKDVVDPEDRLDASALVIHSGDSGAVATASARARGASESGF